MNKGLFAGILKIPALRRLRDENWAPRAPHAVRHTPVLRFHQWPQGFNPEVGGEISCIFVVTEDVRKFYSRKEGQLVGTLCVDNILNHNEGWSAEAPLPYNGSRIVIHIYPRSDLVSQSRFAIVETPTRSTGRGGSTSATPKSEVVQELGFNETPSGNHGLRWWLLKSPFEVTIYRTSNVGNSSERTFQG